MNVVFEHEAITFEVTIVGETVDQAWQLHEQSVKFFELCGSFNRAARGNEASRFRKTETKLVCELVLEHIDFQRAGVWPIAADRQMGPGHSGGLRLD